MQAGVAEPELGGRARYGQDPRLPRRLQAERSERVAAFASKRGIDRARAAVERAHRGNASVFCRTRTSRLRDEGGGGCPQPGGAGRLLTDPDTDRSNATGIGIAREGEKSADRFGASSAIGRGPGDSLRAHRHGRFRWNPKLAALRPGAKAPHLHGARRAERRGGQQRTSFHRRAGPHSGRNGRRLCVALRRPAASTPRARGIGAGPRRFAESNREIPAGRHAATGRSLAGGGR